MSAFGARRARCASIDLLPPEPGIRKRVAPKNRHEAAVDAHFIVLPDDSPAARSPVCNDNRSLSRSPNVAIASRAVRLAFLGLVWAMRLVERLLQLLPRRAFGAVVAGCVIAMFFLAGGLSALATVFTSVGPSDGVEIARVSSSLDDRDGMKVLSVYGTVENRSRDTRAVPAIVVDVIAGGKSIARHRIEPGAGSLPPGSTDAFSLKLPHGGATLPKIAVSFEPAGAPLH